jgi:hypothetical protein
MDHHLPMFFTFYYVYLNSGPTLVFDSQAPPAEPLVRHHDTLQLSPKGLKPMTFAEYHGVHGGDAVTR